MYGRDCMINEDGRRIIHIEGIFEDSFISIRGWLKLISCPPAEDLRKAPARPTSSHRGRLLSIDYVT